MQSKTSFTNKKNLYDKYKDANKVKKWESPDYFYEINGYREDIIKGERTIIHLENDVRADVIKLVELFERTYFPKRIKAIKNYTLCGLDRRLVLKEKGLGFLTNEIQPIVRTYVDRLVQSLFRTSFYIKAYSLTEKKRAKVQLIQQVVERCFSSASVKKSLLDVGTTAILNGTGYVRSGFKAPESTARSIIDGIKESVEIDDFYAQFEWVSEFCVFGEPFIPFNQQRFVVYRKIIPLKTALNKVGQFNKFLTTEQKDILINSSKAISCKNYDKVRLIKYYEDDIIAEKNYNVDNFYDTTYGNEFCEYIERRDEDTLILMINGYIVYDGENTLEGRMSPFHTLNVTNMPGTWIADGIGTLLEGPQRLYDALYNMSFDLMKFQAGPMFLKQPGMGIEGMEKILQYEPFTFVQMTGPGKLETLQMPAPDPTVFKGMTDILNMSNLVISPSSYTQVAGVSRSATDSQARMEGLKDATIILIDNMNRVLTEAANMWLKEMKKKMPDKFTIPIFDEKGVVNEWAKINRTDLDGKFLFERDSESIRDINKVVDRSQLQQLGQFIKMFGQDPIDGRWLIDNNKLLKDGLGLFNKSTEIILSDEQYKASVLKSQKIGMDIQKDLGKYKAKLNPQPEQLQGVGPSAQSSEGQPIERPSEFQKEGSNYNSNPNAKQVGEPELPQRQGVDFASILKQANE